MSNSEIMKRIRVRQAYAVLREYGLVPKHRRAKAAFPFSLLEMAVNWLFKQLVRGVYRMVAAIVRLK